MLFDVTNCMFSTQYHQECHTGRCLFNKEYFFSSESKFSIGCIAKISLCSRQGFELGVVLCTIWPDMNNNQISLPLHSVILDDTVIVSGNVANSLWTDCKGKVSPFTLEIVFYTLFTLLQLILLYF